MNSELQEKLLARDHEEIHPKVRYPNTLIRGGGLCGEPTVTSIRCGCVRWNREQRQHFQGEYDDNLA